MRIALIGLAAFCAKTLEALIKAGEEVVVVGTAPEPDRGKPVADAAQANGIPCIQPSRWRDPDVYKKFSSYTPDLGVMAFVNDKLPGNILQCPRLGTIEYHPSLLPRHRGSSAINWAIIQGESRTGLTIFWVDEGMDTGPILLQKTVDVSPDDTVGSIYFNTLFPKGIEAIVESVKLVREGKAPRIPQDNSKATYEPPIQESHGLIDWSKSVADVYNLIRGTNPQPGATTFYKGKKLKIFDSGRRFDLDKTLVPGAKVTQPGAIVDINADGFAVAANGGVIQVKRVQPEGTGKTPAKDFVAQSGLRIGDKLGS
ncbi:MAG: Methionyl-tRNA formyltransferase [Dehalococcoidia bacterium]|nr:Methionyl-tRNA formyltransferase [Dehalococcoidia bacterium]